MRLWFENSEGKERLIANCRDWKEVNETIDDFIENCNARKISAAMKAHPDDFNISKVQLFKRYYTRVWKQDDGRTRIDIGSHTEFFLYEGELE